MTTPTLKEKISQILKDPKTSGSYVMDMEIMAEDLLSLFESSLKEERENLAEYTQHTRHCIVGGFSAGRPTKDGYEVKIGGKWYQTRPIDKTPKCNCGLVELLGGRE